MHEEVAITLKGREKRRLEPLKRRLFSEGACRSGMYCGARRDSCLHEDSSVENLEASTRDAARRVEQRISALSKQLGNGRHGASHALTDSFNCVPTHDSMFRFTVRLDRK